MTQTSAMKAKVESSAVEKFVLSPDLKKAEAVSFLAERTGLTIGNPWQSSTVGRDIERLAAEIVISGNEDVRFIAHTELGNADEIHVFSTPSRRFPPPHAANSRHLMFDGLPSETYAVATPDFSVLSLTDSYICHFLEAPVIVAPDGRTVVRDYSSNYSGLLHFHPRRLADCTAQARYIDGIVVPIADDVQLANIFHWIIDWLPRLAFLGPGVRKRDIYVVTSPLTAKFQWETLRLCGVDEDRVVTVGNFEAIRARQLLVPSNLGEVVHPGFTAAPWVLSYLRSTLGLGALRQASVVPKAGDRIYVSRRDASHRRIGNEDELAARLARAGYREVALSSLPLVDQIATFTNADSVVGLHGAGLIHFAFTPERARLLEILPQSYAIPTLYLLAAGLDAEYLSYVTDLVIPGSHASFDDVAIDVADFTTRCQEFLA